MHNQTVGNPGYGGIFPGEQIARKCTASEAMSKGDHVMFDMSDASGTALDDVPGATDSKWNTVRYVDDASSDLKVGLKGGVYGILLEDVAAAGTVDVLVYGYYSAANVHASTDDGMFLTVAVDGRLILATGTSGKAIVAIALDEDVVTNFAPVFFNGWGGFYQDGGTPA